MTTEEQYDDFYDKITEAQQSLTPYQDTFPLIVEFDKRSKWIPTSEGLPTSEEAHSTNKDFGFVFCQTIEGIILFVHHSKVTKEKCIAWQLSPEPYKL